MIDQIIDFNKTFVAQKGYEKYLTSKYPDKKLAVLSCMDTRLTELLPAALGLKNGDAKIIKNAGGLVISAFDSAMRSLIVAIYELGVEEIMVVAHSHCGACHMSYDHFHHEMIARGVTDETLDTIRKCGINLDHWLEGFKDTPESVRKTVETIKTHPLVPKDIVVRGFIIDSETGALEEITPSPRLKDIYLAGGCFWGTEHYFKQIDGVVETEVGFANGHTANPSYKEVYTDKTGYAETVHVKYNPDVASLEFLLQMFFKAIDPTSLNKQGNDEGTRYRTGIYYTNDEDLLVIKKVFVEEQKKYQQPLAVEKLPLQNFYTAEEYHQDYLDKNPDGYCHLPESLFEFARKAKEKSLAKG